MANDDHIAKLKEGVAAWNAWRKENPDIRPDLSGANLKGADFSEANLEGANLGRANLERAKLVAARLHGADLEGANLWGADIGYVDRNPGGYHRWEHEFEPARLGRANLRSATLSQARLVFADLGEANLSGAKLFGADLLEAVLRDANLSGASLEGANLLEAVLRGANLHRASLEGANLHRANLEGANLNEANLEQANLNEANLEQANLRGANLQSCPLVNANLTDADLTGARVYGVSAWGLKLERAKQQNLVITRTRRVWEGEDEPEITVDNIEVAQFIYLLLHNEKIRDVIDTVGKKAVLLLGRFTDERKAVLDALREELRKRDYIPILFDFAIPATRDITETVSLLARMARFIIADLTDPSSIPKELEAIVPSLAVPVQPLLEGSARPYAMFKDYWKYHWVLPVYWYEGLEPLLATLAENVIVPAEEKAQALAEQRRMSEAELTKPQ
jgi:uncharacterized protein YjbI with pentapeptide repeats